MLQGQAPVPAPAIRRNNVKKRENTGIRPYNATQGERLRFFQIPEVERGDSQKITVQILIPEPPARCLLSRLLFLFRAHQKEISLVFF